jgi:hypothetical protein
MDGRKAGSMKKKTLRSAHIFLTKDARVAVCRSWREIESQPNGALVVRAGSLTQSERPTKLSALRLLTLAEREAA